MREPLSERTMPGDSNAVPGAHDPALGQPPVDAALAPSAADDLSLKDAFDVYQKMSDGVHKLWTYFQGACLAVLGFAVGSDKIHWGAGAYMFVVASFGVFALGNRWVLVESQRELVHFGAELARAAERSGSIGKALRIRPVDEKKVEGFHGGIVLFVLGALYLSSLLQ